MAGKKWFDPTSNEIQFSKYVEQMESWQRALADGAVEPAEVRAQAERVASMLRALEPKLTNELHEEITNVFYELSVLYGMQRLLEVTAEEQGGQG